MPGGGSKPGERRGGIRKNGTLTDVEPDPRLQLAVRRAAKALMLSQGVTPLDVMVLAMRGDDQVTPFMLSAAMAAAPYVHPRLSSMTVNATIKRSINDFTDEELLAITIDGEVAAIEDSSNSASEDGAFEEAGGEGQVS